MSPIISFVIPVYNNEYYLGNAVFSILRQLESIKEEAIEVIIVDDGSTDRTGIIADELAEKDSRIHVIHQENKWIFGSMNSGVKNAVGEYVYILNSDDLLVKGTVPLLLSTIDEYDNPDVIWTKVVWELVDDEQRVLDSRDFNEKVKEDFYCKNRNEVHKKWFFLQESGLATNQANLYKKALLEKHSFREDVYGADTILNLEIADEVNSMVILKEPVYRYLEYKRKGFNASLKYYDYTHDMFNEIMNMSLKLYEKWLIPKNVYIDFVILKRLRNLTIEIESMLNENCKLSIDSKLEKVFSVSADPELREKAWGVGREREYESRILNGSNKILKNSNYCSSEYGFVKVLTAGLPLDYWGEINAEVIDLEALKAAVNDPLNKDKIGKIYYSDVLQSK
ncbi:glycosyltransferase family 2 protein [Oribacterium sp. P6A1]|uniref:glycosyltransferase family 2 protein n=1 Tax=Oribacterium sp. P6A1 TaxID=1410612 RepID=UPI0018CC3345|nr:glycosyltransferase family 2 protein [Oribacterium sp. P6A1]